MNLAPAHNPEAERSILGAVLLRGGDVLDRVELDPPAFYDPRHRAVYSAMLAVHRALKPVDVLLVAAELGDKLVGLGDLPFLTDLVGGCATADNVEFYAKLVGEAALTRRIRLALSDALNCGDQGEVLLARVLAAATSLSSTQAAGAVTMADLSAATYQEVLRAADARAAGEDVSWGIATKLTELDDMLGGLQPGVITLLGGRPSMGKSALARVIADNVSAAGVGVHVFSMEDARRAYALRALADHGRLDLHRLHTLNLAEGDARKLGTAADSLQRTNWLIDDVAGLSSAQIAMRVRRHKEANQTRVVVVDYVQLMREPDAKRGELRVQIALALQGLAELARRENLALLLVSQLNRELERRDNKRPMMADLREAGELEQHADVIMFVYRDEVYNKNSADAGKGEVIVAKNKHGKAGTVFLKWDAPCASYRNQNWADSFTSYRAPAAEDYR